MQVVIGRRACRLREAKDLYHARILVPPTSTGRHQFGQERRIVDVQFVGRDSHNVAVLGVHVANAKQVLAATEEVMVELQPEGHCCQAWAGIFGKRMQGKAVSVEKEDIEGEGSGDEGGQWPDG